MYLEETFRHMHKMVPWRETSRLSNRITDQQFAYRLSQPTSQVQSSSCVSGKLRPASFHVAKHTLQQAFDAVESSADGVCW